VAIETIESDRDTLAQFDSDHILRAPGRPTRDLAGGAAPYPGHVVRAPDDALTVEKPQREFLIVPWGSHGDRHGAPAPTALLDIVEANLEGPLHRDLVEH